jgi:flagellar basal body-associated protein FliL
MKVLIVIIILAIVLAALVIGLVLMFRVSALYGDMEKLAKWQGEIDNEIKGVKLAIKDVESEQSNVAYPTLDGVVYDKNTSTMTVNGNIKATGWISCDSKER